MHTIQTGDSIVLEKKLRKSKERVWRSLTDAGELSKWFFPLSEFEARTGFIFHLSGSNDGVRYPSTCTVVEVVEGTRLAYDWRFDDFPSLTRVTITLEPHGDGTLLTLVHSGLDSLPKDHPHFSLTDFEEGWRYFLGNLKII